MKKTVLMFAVIVFILSCQFALGQSNAIEKKLIISEISEFQMSQHSLYGANSDGVRVGNTEYVGSFDAVADVLMISCKFKGSYINNLQKTLKALPEMAKEHVVKDIKKYQTALYLSDIADDSLFDKDRIYITCDRNQFYNFESQVRQNGLSPRIDNATLHVSINGEDRTMPIILTFREESGIRKIDSPDSVNNLMEPLQQPQVVYVQQQQQSPLQYGNPYPTFPDATNFLEQRVQALETLFGIAPSYNIQTKKVEYRRVSDGKQLAGWGDIEIK